MVGRRRRRRAIIDPTLIQCLVFAEYDSTVARHLTYNSDFFQLKDIVLSERHVSIVNNRTARLSIPVYRNMSGSHLYCMSHDYDKSLDQKVLYVGGKFLALCYLHWILLDLLLPYFCLCGLTLRHVGISSPLYRCMWSTAESYIISKYAKNCTAEKLIVILGAISCIVLFIIWICLNMLCLLY